MLPRSILGAVAILTFIQANCASAQNSNTARLQAYQPVAGVRQAEANREIAQALKMDAYARQAWERSNQSARADDSGSQVLPQILVASNASAQDGNNRRPIGAVQHYEQQANGSWYVVNR